MKLEVTYQGEENSTWIVSLSGNIIQAISAPPSESLEDVKNFLSDLQTYIAHNCA